jgi:hypothetical protein
VSERGVVKQEFPEQQRKRVFFIFLRNKFSVSGMKSGASHQLLPTASFPDVALMRVQI